MHHWQQLQTMRVTTNCNSVPEKLPGIELHYKVVIIDEMVLKTILKRLRLMGSATKITKRILIVAYKVITHTMQSDALDNVLARQQQ